MWLAASLAAGVVLAGCTGGMSSVAQAGPDKQVAGDVTMRFVAGVTASAAVLPDDIQRGLATDARVLDCQDGVAAGRSAFVTDWVLAHVVDFDGDGRDDWLVEGRHRCFSGDGGVDWWGYAGDADGHRLLFAARRARAVELLARRSHGWRDLRLQRGPDSDALLRFDGSVYAIAAAAAD